MENISALLALWAGNSPVTGEFSSQKPMTWSFEAFYLHRLFNGGAPFTNMDQL